MSEEIKKDSVFATLQLIYRVLKKKELVTDAFIQKSIHYDASTKPLFEELSEEDKLIWYIVMVMFKMIFDEAGNYYKYKEKDPEKFKFLNEMRPFYQSMNRVDLTRAYIFEQAVHELKQVNFQGLHQKTGVTIDPKHLGNVIRSDIIRRTQQM